MKATVLCITPSEEAVGYLTAGKQYDIESTCSDGKCVRVIDDQGMKSAFLLLSPVTVNSANCRSYNTHRDKARRISEV